jgi:putative membrane protein
MNEWNLLAVVQHGFLPTRGSFMLDFVFVAMFLVTVGMTLSIVAARRWKQYRWHKIIQVSLAAILLLAVLAFEVDMRLFTDWKALAKPSPYYASGVVFAALGIHLLFAIPTPFIWTYIIWNALRRFDRPIKPGEHSAKHKRWGWMGFMAMWGTSITGWCFYWLAFVA